MRRQRQRSGVDKRASGATSAAGAAGFDHKPFRELARTPRTQQPVAVPIVTPAPPPPDPPAVDESDLFEREMTGVRPLSGSARSRVAPLPPTPAQRPVTDPDAEALAELSDLVTGSGSFDLANSVEFVEGAVAGVDRRLVRRLRAGDFAFQSHLDLHGMTAAEARVAVDAFLTRAHRAGQRCVLIVHGRGLNSKDQVPVLKQRLTTWLSRGSWSRIVLAFTSARVCDGGAGALYVLLRRRREGKHPINVTQGAKW